MAKPVCTQQALFGAEIGVGTPGELWTLETALTPLAGNCLDLFRSPSLPGSHRNEASATACDDAHEVPTVRLS